MRSTVTGSVSSRSTRARRARPSRSWRSRRGRRLALPTRCSTVGARRGGAGREPHAEPAEYVILPIDQCYELVGLIKSRWEGSPAGRRSSGPCPSSSSGSARGRWWRRDAPARPALAPAERPSPTLDRRARAGFRDHRRRAVPFAASPTMLFCGRSRPSRQAPRSTRSRCPAQVMIDPARRGYDEDTRARLAELFGPPAAGRRRRRDCAGRGSRQPSRVHRHDRVLARAALHLRPRGRGRQVLLRRWTTASVPLSFHFYGTIFYRRRRPAADDAGPVDADRAVPDAGRSWRAMIAEHYPGGGWIRLERDAATRSTPAQRGRAVSERSTPDAGAARWTP